MRLLKLITVAYLSMFQGFCAQISETFLDKPYVIFQETLTFNKELIKPYISQIESDSIGLNLIKKVCELYTKVEGKCGGIIFRNGTQTSFCPRKTDSGQIELIIDIASPEEYRYPLIQSSELSHYFGISGLSSPFTITLAHELIHLKHKLEEIGELSYSGIAGIPYSIAKTIGIENIFDGTYSHLFSLLAELQEVRLNMNELWPNLEERRTVIGPDVDNISEHTLRKSMGIPSRFIYQNKDLISLEKQETILKIINDPILPDEYSIKSEVSILTPLDILLKLGKKDEIIALLDERPISPLTQNIFRIILDNSEVYNFVSEEVKSFMIELLSHKPKPLIFDFKW